MSKLIQKEDQEVSVTTKDIAVLKGILIVLDGTYKSLLNQLTYNRLFSMSVILLLIMTSWLAPTSKKHLQVIATTGMFTLIVTTIAVFWWFAKDKANKRISILEKELLSVHVMKEEAIFLQKLLTLMRHERSKSINTNILLRYEPLAWWLLAQLSIIIKFGILT